MQKKIVPVVLLTSLLSCSTYRYQTVETTAPVNPHLSRSLASAEEADESLAEIGAKVRALTERIFHSYLLGHELLKDFDRQLEKDPASAMTHRSYYQLLALRTQVDHFEHEILDLYIDLVLAEALPEYTAAQKERARLALAAIDSFIQGIPTDRAELPENLKVLVLSNLVEKQTELLHNLREIHNDPTLGDRPEAKAVIHSRMVQLRGARMSFNRELRNYRVDEAAFKQVMDQESRRREFRRFRQEIREHAREMRDLVTEIRGRGTSSDVITPSAGAAGNITGRGFPANTWAITYDDGPGAGTADILGLLGKRKASFYMLARQAEALPARVRDVVNGGHEIANHSYTHPQLTKVSAAALEREIGTSKQVIERQSGKTVTTFLLPYCAGVNNPAIRQKIAQHKMVHIFWNVDTLDWQDKDPQSIFRRTLTQMNANGNKGVILFHDIHRQTVEATRLLMRHFDANPQLKVCTVQGVIDQTNRNLSSCE